MEYFGRETKENLQREFSEIIVNNENMEMLYGAWAINYGHRFEKMILVSEDPFLSPSNGVLAAEQFDYLKEEDVWLAEIIDRVYFYVMYLNQERKAICKKIYQDISSSAKIEMIKENYLKGVQDFSDESAVYKVIKECAELGMVLYDTDALDMHAVFELANALAYRYTPEDAYIYFSLWRLTKEKKYLKRTLSVADRYLTENMYALLELVGGNLLDPVSGMKIHSRLAIIISKFEICEKAAEVIYKNAEADGTWKEEFFVSETDDDAIIERTTSLYTLLLTKMLWNEKGEDYAKNKASLSVTYRAMCKGMDILLIMRDCPSV